MIWMLGSPLIGMVSSVAKGATGIASGVAKGIGKAVSGTEKEAEMSANAGNGDTTPAINTKGAPVNFEEESPVSDMFGGLDLAKVKSALDDEGPMGPPEPEAPTVYKRMIAVLKTMSETLLRMENTMKMLLAIEYERVKGMVAQSTAENITLAQTPDDDDDSGEKRGLFGRGKDMIGGAWKKAKDSPTWLKMLGLGGLLLAIKFWKEDLEKAVAKILEWLTKAYEYFTQEGFGWEMFKTDFTEKFLPKLKDLVWGSLDWVWNMIKSLAREWLGGVSDKNVQKNVATLDAPTEGLSALQEKYGDLGKMGTALLDKSKFKTGDAKLFSLDKLSDEDREKTTKLAQQAWQAMWGISEASGWTIQWTNMPKMTGVATWGTYMTDLMSNWNLKRGVADGVAIADMIESKPIINGEIMDRSALQNYNSARLGGYTMDMPEGQRNAIIELNKELTDLAHSQHGQQMFGSMLDLKGSAAGQMLQDDIEVKRKSLLLQKESLGAGNMVVGTDGSLLIASAGTSAQALKDAKIEHETISAPPSVIVNTDNANKSTTVVNQGDTVMLNGKNDYAVQVALNEVTGVRNVFGYT